DTGEGQARESLCGLKLPRALRVGKATKKPSGLQTKSSMSLVDARKLAQGPELLRLTRETEVGQLTRGTKLVRPLLRKLSRKSVHSGLPYSSLSECARAAARPRRAEGREDPGTGGTDRSVYCCVEALPSHEEIAGS